MFVLLLTNNNNIVIKRTYKKNMGQPMTKCHKLTPSGELPFYSIKKNTPKMKELEQIYNFNNIFFY